MLNINQTKNKQQEQQQKHTESYRMYNVALGTFIFFSFFNCEILW